MNVRGLLAAGIVLIATTSNADTIGTSPFPPAFFLSGFGSNEVYRGQTFEISTASLVLADNLSVFLGPTFDDVSFRVLVTETERTSGNFPVHPTNVLFESATLTLPRFERSATRFDVDLGGIALRPGQEYAWLLDYFVAGSPIGFNSANTGIGSYSDGTALRFVNGPGFPSGTRADNFALDNWFDDPSTDFAFELTYTSVPVPEPAASLLVVGGLLAALHRRRSRP